MNEISEPNFLSGDKPKTDPKEDLLGYAPFAEHLAKSIRKMAPPEGLVIAIYGPWGSGKSSVLEFIIHNLENPRGREDIPVIVRFNPWWFSGQEDLTRHFFGQLQVVFSNKLGELGKKLANPMGDLAELVSKFPEPHIKAAGEIGIRFFKRPLKDVIKLKEEIAQKLASQTMRILIVIDDIDRLTADEIRQLFLLIKAVADFPNVTYLLAFDKNVVSNALDGTQGKGEAYLEKIVQTSFELPLPEQLTLFKFLHGELKNIIGDIPRDLYDENFLGHQGYLTKIKNFLHTPRDVSRFINSLKVTFPALRDEVNPSDFVAIEAIRIFFSEVYIFIRENESMFTGTQISNDDMQLYQTYMVNLPKALTELVQLIFPKFQAPRYGNDYEIMWRKEMRICSASIFDSYFRLNVSSASISNTTMRRLLNLTHDFESFGQEIIRVANQPSLGGINRSSLLLNRLTDYIDDIDSNHIPNVVKAFFKIGDTLEEDNNNPFDSNFGTMISTSYSLLMKKSESERMSILSRAIAEGDANWLSLRMMANIWRQHGRFGADRLSAEEKKLITLEDLEELEIIILNKVYSLSKDIAEIFARRDRLFFEVWSELDSTEVRTWIANYVIVNDELLLKFIRYFQRPNFDKICTNLKELTLFLDPDAVKDILRDMSNKRDLSKGEKYTVDGFVDSYQEFKEGKNNCD